MIDFHRGLTGMIKALADILPGLGFLKQYASQIDEVGYKMDAYDEQFVSKRQTMRKVKDKVGGGGKSGGKSSGKKRRR